ncbi:PH domain-containing protein [Paenibacillus yanchengensis]|uniref:PH domain-containing protein n=1 Tax=Paenibacillus yanchengensis TaxID=2035833 RepID=A0ABW4YIU6_9BACL
MNSENELWSGKPFNFGFPSFTSYKLTDRRLIIEKGFFTKRREEIQLYRIRDISLKRNLLERVLGFGDIMIHSTDTSNPSYLLRNVRQSTEVSDQIGFAVEEARLRYRSYEVSEVAVPT